MSRPIMHELSIATALVEVAQQAALEAQAPAVSVVRLRLGALAGVDAQALLSCYELATTGTLLAGSTLQIEELPVVIYCPDCQSLTTLEDVYGRHCGRCGRQCAQIRQGRELELVSLEVPDVATPG